MMLTERYQTRFDIAQEYFPTHGHKTPLGRYEVDMHDMTIPSKLPFSPIGLCCTLEKAPEAYPPNLSCAAHKFHELWGANRSMIRRPSS